MTEVLDDTRCQLGEGPLWHPTRQQLFWFDILGKELRTTVDGAAQVWSFDEHVSAAGWLNDDQLLIASESGLHQFDIGTGKRDLVAAMEADNPITRSNDGRADPYGGFWIGTMGKSAEKKAGAICRYYRGELRQLFDGITISNAICFSPDGLTAYSTDTMTGRVLHHRLDEATGWPAGDPEVFLDLREAPGAPDGAVVDAEGNFWNAQWGGSRVACYDPEGVFLHAVDVPALQVTCPAFGGPELTTLYVTSAADGLDDPDAGKTFFTETSVRGQAEHRVIL